MLAVSYVPSCISCQGRDCLLKKFITVWMIRGCSKWNTSLRKTHTVSWWTKIFSFARSSSTQGVSGSKTIKWQKLALFFCCVTLIWWVLKVNKTMSLFILQIWDSCCCPFGYGLSQLFSAVICTNTSVIFWEKNVFAHNRCVTHFVDNWRRWIVMICNQ